MEMKGTKLLLVLMVAPMVLHAQITLDECQQKAMEHYPEVAQYDLIAQSEEYSIATAQRSWIPQITLSGQATWQNAVAEFPEKFTDMITAMGGEAMPGMAKDQYRVALDVNQVIWDGGVSRHNKELARAQATEKRLTSDTDIYALQERVNSLFFGILLLDENYRTAESSREILEANRSMLESMYNNGAALRSDIDMVQVEIITLEQGMEQNRASREYFCKMLELFIGQEVDSLVKPVEIITPMTGNNRPELSLMDAKIATLDAQEGLLRTTLTPKLSVFAQGFYGNPGLDMFKAMQSRDWTWNAVLGMRMQWNVSALFTYNQDRKKLENGRSMLAVQKQVFEFNSNLQTEQQNGEIGRMRKSLDSDRQIVELRGNIRRTAQSQFEHGTLDTATLLRRIAEETTAMNNMNIHEIELLKTEYELSHTVNQK